MKYGIVIRNLTDLRTEPGFRAERKSQLLLGEPIVVGDLKNGYLSATQNDGYCGWVDEKAIRLISKSEWRGYQNDLNYQVVSPTAKVHPLDNSFNSPIPQFLFYGTRLFVSRTREKMALFHAPDGNKFKISMKNIEVLSKLQGGKINGNHIVKEANKFLGVPYLWGGITPFGFDCSGLVQMAYKRYGFEFPRDSKDQRTVGVRIKRDEIKPGDLIFFPGHVVIAMGKNKIIHASLGEGGVQVNSLNPADPDFRKDLYDSYTEARRVLP
ncbi:MAG: C40 family peptidase [Candidatus Zixiibacteriota bacterium]